MTSARSSGRARIASQLLNSASSALFSLGLVAATSDAELGAITIQILALPLLLGVARTGVFETVLFKSSATERQSTGWIPAAAGAALGVTAAVATFCTGWLLGTPVGLTVALASVSTTVLLLDGLRFTAFALNRDSRSVWADATWVVAMVAIGTVVISTGRFGATSLAWTYSAAGAMSALAMLPVLKRLTVAAPTRQLLRSMWFGWDFAILTVPAYLSLIVAAMVASLADVGTVRAAVLMYAPLAALIYGSRIVANDAVRRRPLNLRLVYSIAALSYTTAVVTMFTVLGPQADSLLGALPIPVLTVVGLGECSLHLVQASIDEQRVRGRERIAFKIRATQSSLLLGLTAILGSLFAALGLAWARLFAYSATLSVSRWISQQRNARSLPSPSDLRHPHTPGSRP